MTLKKSSRLIGEGIGEAKIAATTAGVARVSHTQLLVPSEVELSRC